MVRFRFRAGYRFEARIRIGVRVRLRLMEKVRLRVRDLVYTLIQGDQARAGNE